MKAHLCRVSLFAQAAILWVAAAGLAGAWLPGTSDPWAVDGFAVDRTDRRDVLAFYHCVYIASEGYRDQHNWTGNAATCTAGTTSEVFQDDVLRRVNFVRALTGLPADIYFTTTKSAKAQQAALMMSKAGILDHFPAISWPCYTADGSAAAAAGNLALGSYGPTSIDEYMRDDGDGNRPVGHRRWILYSRAKEMGTGDIPAHSSYPSTNALWVVGDFKPTPAAAFSAWPNNGFFPLPLMPARWSLSYPGADFASATVSMTAGGSPVPVTVVSRTDTGMGDNTIVWEPSSLPSSLDDDLSYTITVAGIGGGGPTSRAYTVTIFDPNALGDSVAISGPASLPVTGQPYTFNPIDQADEYELEVASLDGSAWTEGAEDSPVPRIEEAIAPGYTLRQSALTRTGSKAFQLTYPSGVFSDQSFVITRDIVPAAESRLTFHDRARFSTETTTLEAQVSSNGGESWTTLFSREGVGGHSDLWDASWIARDIDLSAYAGPTPFSPHSGPLMSFLKGLHPQRRSSFLSRRDFPSTRECWRRVSIFSGGRCFRLIASEMSEGNGQNGHQWPICSHGWIADPSAQTPTLWRYSPISPRSGPFTGSFKVPHQEGGFLIDGEAVAGCLNPCVAFESLHVSRQNHGTIITEPPRALLRWRLLRGS